ncbi:MAG: hypothetical protein Q9M91_05465 [Candidatus Dojkabacteria bacterium]|nr:hypothetical protein [Candidatus Dojkabacteria bacterium]MDQ7021251.1 hypothetical protein [Candidatus Dojkabacteria bacterium]
MKCSKLDNKVTYDYQYLESQYSGESCRGDSNTECLFDNIGIEVLDKLTINVCSELNIKRTETIILEFKLDKICSFTNLDLKDIFKTERFTLKDSGLLKKVN